MTGRSALWLWMTGSAPSGTLSRPKRWPRRSPITPGIAVIRLSYHQPIVKPEPKMQKCLAGLSIVHFERIAPDFASPGAPLGRNVVCNVAGRAHVGGVAALAQFPGRGNGSGK